ncbi:hypothetical protein FACS189472_12510 [Alphaproteobacteria bacterium]|nr:hypothetical protein FACS189472_12510 [Alphaproteobacteria bacterium]
MRNNKEEEAKGKRLSNGCEKGRMRNSICTPVSKKSAGDNTCVIIDSEEEEEDWDEEDSRDDEHENEDPPSSTTFIFAHDERVWGQTM